MKEYMIQLMPGLFMAVAYFVGVICGVHWSEQEKKESRKEKADEEI